MADKSVRVILTATTAGFIAEVRKAETAAKGLAATLGKASTTESWKKVSTDLGVVGLALSAVAGLAVKAWADFDAQMSAVAATGQDAKGALDDLRAAALQAGADTKYSATEAAAGVEALLKAGLTSSDVLGGALTGALNLAASGNMSVADSAETAATAMVQFGLSGKAAGHVADLLAAGAGKAQGEVSDMAAALKQSGLVAAQAGLSIEETTGTLAAFASAGLIGSDAGTSFRTMLLHLMNPSKEAATLISEYGISLYDTSGKFVTMTDLAGQLQAKLGTLTNEQRNAALATIFGSDAIRGANVLYTQGAKGIADWTKSVDDTGYAAQVAGEKMNNLKGDIETLMGSLDTLMVSGGSATGGVLRSMVQQLTELVNVASRNPEAAQGIVTLVAALGGMALLAAGVMKTVTAVTEFQAAISALSAASPRAAAAVTSISAAAGKAAIALAIAAAAVHVLKDSMGDMAGVAQGQVALVSLASSADLVSESMDRMFQRATPSANAWGTTDLATGVNDLDSALERLAHNNLEDFIQGATYWIAGASTNLQDITAQFGKLDQAMAKVDPETARAAFAKISESAAAQGMSVEKLISLFPEYKARLEATASSLGVTTLKAQDYADWMGGKVPAAIQTAIDATKGGTDASKGLSDALTQQQLAAQKAAEEQDALANAIKGAADAALAASGSAISYQKSIDDAAESLAKNGKTLDINTEAGRANRAALDDVADSARKMVEANAANGAKSDELTAQMANGRAEFIKTAMQMGMNKQAAEALATQYGLIPGTVKTVSTFDPTGTRAAQTALDNLKDKTVWVTVETTNAALIAAYGKGARTIAAATGGQITGPGTGTSDSIPAWLSNGEFIVNAAATAKNLSLLHAINSGRQMPAFAAGGMVAPAASSVSTAVSVGSPNVGVVVVIDGNEVRGVVRQEITAAATEHRYGKA